jgi:hypothetical protein
MNAGPVRSWRMKLPTHSHISPEKEAWLEFAHSTTSLGLSGTKAKKLRHTGKDVECHRQHDHC